MKRAAAGLLAGVALVVAGRCAPGDEAALPSVVTYNEHVAPIVFEHCAPCHRPGGAGPFPLIRHADVRDRARQIVEVTRDRTMPPWLPADDVAFAGARRLTERQIRLLRRWVDGGATEGDPALRPAQPAWPAGWQLGHPDLVLRLEGYRLPAAGRDVYRNFVLPAEVERTSWVAAVELRPGNRRVIHHGRVLIDRSGESRRLAAADPEPGFEGMTIGTAHNPDGMLMGWTPGRLPLEPTPGMAWRLDAGTDVVLQLHMVPSGKPEPIEVSLGLYFAAEPPTLHPSTLVLGTRSIDIPAGEPQHVIEDRYELPVDVRVLGVYPHAHYLGQRMELRGELRDGTRVPLLTIPEWNFDWQDEYRYREPVELSAGTRLVMRYTYDNSSENVRNPHDPPRRVTYGARTVDEMAELALQVLTADGRARAALESDWAEHSARKAIAFRRELLARFPDDVESLVALASGLLRLGRPGEAAPPLAEALELAPDHVRAHNNLGWALRETGDLDGAIAAFRRAAELDPGSADAGFNLAQALLQRGRLDEAVAEYRRVLRLRPGASRIHAGLGRALRRSGDADGALDQLRRALDLEPAEVSLLCEAAWVVATHPSEAVRRSDEGLRWALLAKRLARREPVVGATLAACHAARGEFEQALSEIDAALAQVNGDPARRAELERHRELYRRGRAQPVERAAPSG